jgi:hypothetical protein
MAGDDGEGLGNAPMGQGNAGEGGGRGDAGEARDHRAGDAAAAIWADRRVRDRPVAGLLLLATVTWSALGGRSLALGGRALGDAVRRGELERARQLAPTLVGRDPSGLDERQRCRAAVESVAENTADAVVGAHREDSGRCVCEPPGGEALAGHRRDRGHTGECMSRIRPARWVASQAASGVRDLPRNGVWLLSKALKSPVAATESTVHDTSDGLRRVTIAVADKLPGATDSVGMKLKRAETAVARAKEAERRALAEAQNASELADAAKSVSEDGKRRVGEATREGKQEVQRRTQEARERFARLVNQEREKAEQEVAERIERITADVKAESEKARAEAERLAEHAQALIEDAHQQMVEARALAAEATAAAQEAADQAHAHARAVAEKVEEQSGSADRVVKDARRAESALANEAARAVQAEQEQPIPARLSEHTKAELVELARPLQIENASRMTKDQLVRAIRSASRARQRS